MKIAIYPGSFDPITLGHLDIIRRAALCFDKVYVCVMDNCNKKAHMFPAEKRLEMLRRSVADLPNVEAVPGIAGRLRPGKGRPHHRQGPAQCHGL